MNRKSWITALMLVACAVFITTAMAADKPNESKEKATTKVAANERITLDIRGSECDRCAKVLTTALAQHGVHATVSASQGKPFRAMASVDQSTDLGAAGLAVMAANTPHKAKVAPHLDLVMFAKLDKDSAKKVTEALGKVKGLDSKESKADPEKGELSVRIVGGTKVTADEISRALHDAGIAANFTKTATGQTS